ncbi:MAG: TonB-dependent receptor [Prevotella sp.]|nr:TonB-dependent receptor [Prevotella sp.]
MEKRLMMVLTCLLLSISAVFAQNAIKGTVVSSEDGQPVIGATVKVVGTNNGTVTDANGLFEIKVNNGTLLEISYIGMETKTAKASANMRVVLTSDDKMLDEVMVVAYGTAKRQSVTGAVSAIDSKEIDKRIGTSVTAALEGAAPGVQVNNTYGEPGAEPSIRIRGIGTINGSNSPLYVVDGVVYSGNIADLNPNDIQSMSVLKDAASAALYGNRAAAGVILITTKSGASANKADITLKVNTGWYTRGIKEYDRVGVKDFMESSWKAMRNWAMTGSLGLDETAAKAYATENVLTDVIKSNIFDAASNALFDADGRFTANVLPGYTDLDWEDNIERTGSRQEYNLTGSFASEKVRTYSSIGYLKEKGYVIGSDYERYTGRVNTTYTPNKWVTTGLNLNATISKRHFNDSAKESYYSNPFYTARYMAPVYPVYMHNADGSIQYDANGEAIYDTTSPYLDNRNIAYELRRDYDEQRRNVLDGTAFLTLNLPYGFSATVRGNMAHRTNNRTHYNNAEIGDGATNNGRLSSYAYEYSTATLQQLINWDKQYGVHHVDAMVGHENYEYNVKSFYGMNTNMAIPGIYVPSTCLTNSYVYGSDTDYKTESYLARVRYNYDEKYFFDASFRRDGSSRFHPDNRWGNFFSVGASWNIKKEDFLKDVNWVDQLRLRASYGEVGNDAGVDYYGYQALYYIDKNGGNSALMKQSLAANDIKWETTQTVDIAVEGRLFNRLNFSIGYFDKRNKDLLFAVRLPYSAGAFSYNDETTNLTISKNIGTISNRGFEIALDGDVIATSDWKWNIGVDATFLKNKIVKLPNGNNILSGMHNYTEGRSLYDFYTYHFEGVDQMTGNSLYTLDPEKKATAEGQGKLVNINGVDYTTDTAYGLRDFHGTAAPTVYGSVSSNLSWKDFNLSMLFTYSLGGKVFDGSYQRLMSTNAMSSGSAMHKDIVKSWNGVPAGMTETSANRIDPNGIPVLDYNLSTFNNATSDRWLTSASYLVFKNLNLSYSLPKALIHKANVGVTGLNVVFGVENLFTITGRKGMNPQYNFMGGYDDTYVSARVYNLGLTVNF